MKRKMGEVSEIIKDLNWPKQILDKSEALLKTLFGPSFEELGGMISDQVKLRRFKNQLKIFTKAQVILKEQHIDPKKVSLKVLAPLIELSSYEEDETLQAKWSSLTAHILTENSDTIFQQNCISILNKISNEDAQLLDKLFLEFNIKKESKRQKEISYELQYPTTFKNRAKRAYKVHEIRFNLNEIREKIAINTEKIEFQLSNLVALGLIKWETEVEVTAEKSDEDPDDKDIDVEVNVSNNDIFVFTFLGIKSVVVCKEKAV